MHDGGTVRGAVACARVLRSSTGAASSRVSPASARHAFLLVDACLAADPAVEPNAADLVREVRAGEDWLYQIDSLQLCVEGTWSHSPESIAPPTRGTQETGPQPRARPALRRQSAAQRGTASNTPSISRTSVYDMLRIHRQRITSWRSGTASSWCPTETLGWL